MYQVIMTRGTVKQVVGSYPLQQAQSIAEEHRATGYWWSVNVVPQ